MFTNTRSLSVWLALALVCVGCTATPGRVDVRAPIAALDAPKGLAIGGFDAVSYFVDGKPQRGKGAFTMTWQGVAWQFSSAAHREQFAASPARYAPQYGGYCAYAVSRGTTAEGDPRVWALVDNKLYLNNNKLAQTLWNGDQSANIVAGDQNWPLIPKTISKSMAPTTEPANTENVVP